jgi:hypothetical protein
MVTEAHFSSCLQLKDSLNAENIDHNWYTLANESLANSGDLGEDSSGNGNDWTNSGVSQSATVPPF